MKRIQIFILYFVAFLKRYTKKSVLFKNKSHTAHFSNPKVFVTGGIGKNFNPSKFKGLRAFLNTHQKSVFGVCVVILILLLLWNLKSYYKNYETLSEGIIGLHTQENLPPVVTNLLSEPLVKLDEKGFPSPHLIQMWETNEQISVYRFKINDNLAWSDGSLVKSNEIQFRLPDLEVSYPDEKSIEFKLADSFAPFPTLVTNPVFKNNSLVGLGKFKIESIEYKGQFISSMVVSSRDDKDPSTPKIVFRFYPDERTAKTAFDLGEIDSIIGPQESIDLQNQQSLKLKQITRFDKLTAIFYNLEDPVLSDENFRKALNAATPKFDGEERAVTSIPPFSWAFNTELKDPINDIEMAKTHLKKVQKGADSMITLTTTPSQAVLGKQIISGWSRAGINAVLRIESGIPQQFQALLITESIPSDPDQYALWHSTQTKTNISKYSFARVDKDLEDARKSKSREERELKYHNIQKDLAQDVPATFLFFQKQNIIYRKNVEDKMNQILPLQIPMVKTLI